MKRFLIFTGIWYLVSAFLLSSVICFAQVGKADALFESGMEKYTRDDLTGAIADFEKVLKVDPKHKAATSMLGKVFFQEGEKYQKAGDYKAALRCLERASKLLPTDKKISKRYALVKQKVESLAEAARRKKEAELTAAQRRAREKRERELRRKQEQERIAREKARKREQEQRRIAARKSREEALRLQAETLQKKYEKARRWVIGLAVFSVVGAGLVFLITYFILKQKHIQREETFLGYQKRILDLMEKQIAARGEETEKIVVAAPAGGREVITDINSKLRERAKTIEGIEATVTDPKVGASLVKPFLQDRDSRIKATAARALYKYEPKPAMDALTEMAKSLDKWMRLSAAWALGEIGNEGAATMLIGLLEDPDTHVKNRALASLKKISEERKSELLTEVLQKVNQAIAEKAK